MKKIAAKQIARGGKAIQDTSGLDKYPQLAGFLTDTLYHPEDGKEAEDREPGTVWFGARSGVIHVILKEPSQGLMLRLEVPSMASMLKLIESALGAEASMWEADPYAKRKKGSKRAAT